MVYMFEAVLSLMGGSCEVQGVGFHFRLRVTIKILTRASRNRLQPVKRACSLRDRETWKFIAIVVLRGLVRRRGIDVVGLVIQIRGLKSWLLADIGAST